MTFFNKHNKFSASPNFLGREKFAKKNRVFDNVEEPFAQCPKKVEILKRFIGHFPRRRPQPVSCVKIVAWAVENNYLQDYVLFFRQYSLLRNKGNLLLFFAAP